MARIAETLDHVMLASANSQMNQLLIEQNNIIDEYKKKIDRLDKKVAELTKGPVCIDKRIKQWAKLNPPEAL